MQLLNKKGCKTGLHEPHDTLIVSRYKLKHILAGETFMKSWPSLHENL